MHWPDPAQRPRIVEIRDNLIARIDEAEREGWLGEVQGLTISLAGANDKLAQIDQRPPTTAVNLGMPTNGKNNHPQSKIISSENPKASHSRLTPTNLTLGDPSCEDG